MFWQMLPREFLRRVEVFEAKERRHFYHMLNAFGMVMGGKKWRWQSSDKPKPIENIDEREKVILRRVEERRQRKAA